MSELITIHGNRTTIRLKLLTGVSALSLAAYISSASLAGAEETGKPQVWIELGGGFTQLDNSGEPFEPPFTLRTNRKSFITDGITGIQDNASATWDGTGKITFAPPGTDWTLSVGVRYGRDSRNKLSSQKTAVPKTLAVIHMYYAYQNAAAHSSENHLMLDFQAGKDIGVGMFGHDGHSTIDVGIRYAQLAARNAIDIQYNPTNNNINFNHYYASAALARKFTGIGPSIEWTASAALAGDADEGGISFDWGANAAALFGRQTVRGQHHSAERFISRQTANGAFLSHSIYRNSAPLDRSRRLVVPNLGGFAAISWFYPDAKISVGYKADFFFNAIDGGIDTRKTYDRNFYGPFATISVGLGG